MSKTASDLTVAEIQHYRLAMQQRAARAQREAQARAAHARRVAVRAAALLKTEFGVRHVWLFGSVARGTLVHPRSDIDLAVEGLLPEQFWKAWCRLDTVAETYHIDLVSIESAKHFLHQEIEREGIEL